jgi:hypothetical protein
VASTLTRWLAGRSAADLAVMLRRRPDVLVGPPPPDLGDLARRLQSRPSVALALQSVPLPLVQLIEIIEGYGRDSRESVLAIAPGAGPVLDELAGWGLAWEHDGRLRLPGELRAILGPPLHLGPVAATLLDKRAATELRGIAGRLGLVAEKNKSSLVRQICAILDDADAVAALAARAPTGTAELLEKLAWYGPAVASPVAIYSAASTQYAGDAGWAIDHGLLVVDNWVRLVMPREVALALRGPDWAPPFDPTPTLPETAPADPEPVAREAGAAATTLLDGVASLLASGPVALLKSGGVGAREQRRLARLLGTGEADIRLWLELAYEARLCAIADGQLVPTEAYDTWLAAEPGERLLPLLVAWPFVTAVPLADEAPPALTHDPAGRLVTEVRVELLRTLEALPAATGLADPAGLGAVLTWRAPILAGSFEDLDAVLGPLWTDARQAGIVALGRLSPLGEGLLAEEPATLASAATALVGRSTTEAIFQADLTAVVPGNPGAALVDLLDAAADREARGAASVWRFSAASVRRALDAGRTAAELSGALRGVAVSGQLPQPLEYLLTDVERRHGLLRVRAVGCVLRAGDPALLAEVRANRALVNLRLTELAPTVLASPAQRGVVLAALRAAGYAPVGEDASGLPVIEKVTQVRAPVPAPRRPVRVAPAPAVPADDLALELLAAPLPPERAAAPAPREAPQKKAPTGPADLVAERAGQLSPKEQDLLVRAIETGEPVRIGYTDQDGRTSSRVIEPLSLNGSLLEAWCHLRDDERNFNLAQIRRVAAVSS